jgi:hypothetical protein
MEGSRCRFAPIFLCLIALNLLSLPLHAAPTVIRELIVPSLTVKEASNSQLSLGLALAFTFTTQLATLQSC